jgi:hypothetical protein
VRVKKKREEEIVAAIDRITALLMAVHRSLEGIKWTLEQQSRREANPVPHEPRPPRQGDPL